MAERFDALYILAGDFQAAFENDREFFREMLTLFLTGFSNATEQIRADLTRGNQDAAARHLHALRGAAGNLRALEVMRSAGELEQAVAPEEPTPTNSWSGLPDSLPPCRRPWPSGSGTPRLLLYRCRNILRASS